MKFKRVVDPYGEEVQMVLLENPDGGRDLVGHQVDMAIKPTNVYPIEELE